MELSQSSYRFISFKDIVIKNGSGTRTETDVIGYY